MKLLLIIVLNLMVLTATAQKQAAIEKVDILDKTAKLVLPPAFAAVDNQTTYTSFYQCDGRVVKPFVRLGSARSVEASNDPDYTLEAVTTISRNERNQISKSYLIHPDTRIKYYYAVFCVVSTSDFYVKDYSGNIIKYFAISNLEPTTYYYCVVEQTPKLLPAREFESLMKSDPAKVSGALSIEELDIELGYIDYGSGDRRDVKTKNLDFIFSEIKNRVAAISTEITNFMFTPTRLDGLFSSGFKMHGLKKSSVNNFPQIDAKTVEIKELISTWADDMKDVETLGRLCRIAEEIEKLGDESTDKHIRVLCYSNASLGYMLGGELEKARIARGRAFQNDNSFFGVVGQTAPSLYEYLYKRDMIISNSTIDYRKLVTESQIK